MVICKDQGDFKVSKANNIVELCIYLIDDSEMPSIYALAKDMVVRFRGVNYLDLWFKRRCEILSFFIIDRRYNRVLSKGYIYYLGP